MRGGISQEWSSSCECSGTTLYVILSPDPCSGDWSGDGFVKSETYSSECRSPDAEISTDGLGRAWYRTDIDPATNDKAIPAWWRYRRVPGRTPTVQANPLTHGKPDIAEAKHRQKGGARVSNIHRRDLRFCSGFARRLLDVSKLCPFALQRDLIQLAGKFEDAALLRVAHPQELWPIDGLAYRVAGQFGCRKSFGNSSPLSLAVSFLRRLINH